MGKVFAQVGYVESRHPVYSFLERMQTEKMISGFNSFELPKTRKDVAGFLIQLNERVNKLSSVDKNILSDFIEEFSLEVNNKIQKSFLEEPAVKYYLSDKEKYLFSYSDKQGSSFFVNLIGSLSNYYHSTIKGNDANLNGTNTSIINFGGVIRGSLHDKIGFEIKATNGTFYGNRNLASTKGEAKYSYKFIYGTEDNGGTDYFDQTAGFLTYQNDWLKLKIGRDKLLIGQGIVKDILSDNSPGYDYINLSLKYKAFTYSFIHAKLLGHMTFGQDEFGANLKNVGVKNFVYHRFGLRVTHNTFLGLGETIIYTDRDIDLSYLNPFNFYKSVEHANQDRDNSMMFFDVTNYSLPGIKLYASLLIDDMDFSKFGTSWLGNITILNTGIYTTLLHNFIPVDLELQYLRLDPYAYSHRVKKNNYTNFDSPLGALFQPNTSAILFKLTYTPHHRVWMNATARYSVHGNNDVDAQGNLINNGGDINYGYRANDSKNAKFLSGPKDYNREVTLQIKYQPIKNYFVYFGFDYQNSTGYNSGYEYFEPYLGFSVKM